ncbi:MAG: radical SAM protein, partial [Eggerthellaceae bacterium]|nr:radical SAM protein [Eggerthellaceae bacterium]
MSEHMNHPAMPLSHPGSVKPHMATHGIRPGAGSAAQEYFEKTGIKAPRIVAWELTRRCNLHCAHCRAGAENLQYQGELTFEQAKALVDDIASISDPVLILTGGEPLMCEYVWDIIAYAKQKGLHPVMGTNATMIDEDVAKKLADAGIPRISVSLDFPSAQDHDTFRGEKGAFDAAMAGIREARRAGVEVQINSTITKLNANRVQEMHDLAVSLDTQAFHPFLLVPTGRGKELADVELSPEEYEEVLLWAYRCQKT